MLVNYAQKMKYQTINPQQQRFVIHHDVTQHEESLERPKSISSYVPKKTPTHFEKAKTKEAAPSPRSKTRGKRSINSTNDHSTDARRST